MNFTVTIKVSDEEEPNWTLDTEGKFDRGLVWDIGCVEDD